MAEAKEQTHASDDADSMELLLTQNNEKRCLKVTYISPNLAELLGYLRSDVEGKPLETILGNKAKQAVDDLMDFEDEHGDADEVLKRISSFTLKHYKGHEISFLQKLYREPARDHHPMFRVILRNERRQIEDSALPNILRENLAGIYSTDEQTGLADKECMEKYLTLVENYLQTHGLSACLAILRIDRFDKSIERYGAQACQQLVQHVASLCKGKFREEDLVCYLGGNEIGLLLMNTTPDAARIVLNRLRWHIASHRIEFGGKSDFSLTTSVVFTEINPKTERNALDAIDHHIATVPQESRNQLIEV